MELQLKQDDGWYEQEQLDQEAVVGRSLRVPSRVSNRTPE